MEGWERASSRRLISRNLAAHTQHSLNRNSLQHRHILCTQRERGERGVYCRQCSVQDALEDMGVGKK